MKIELTVKRQAFISMARGPKQSHFSQGCETLLHGSAPPRSSDQEGGCGERERKRDLCLVVR